jgi:GNAT superfamily N-acetyltransferase
MGKTVETASSGDEAAAIATLTLAFAADPMTRWSWPDPRTYLEVFPKAARAFGGAAFQKGSAHRIEGCAGVTLWLPPGVESDVEALGELMRTTMKGQALMDSAQIMPQMESYHPKEPHWYLPMIGIDPQYQGKGLGGALLDHGVAFADRDGVPAYLESSNPRNISLYERHGFERLGRIQVGSSPTLVPMQRKPQRRT